MKTFCLNPIKWIVLILLGTIFPNINAESSTENIFSEIYEKKIWGSSYDDFGSSGGGSKLETTILYRKFLQEFFAHQNIHSIIDVGCGDWEFSRSINWNGIDYIGYDVVPKIIANNQLKFGKSNIHFQHGNAVDIDLPSADLLLCKDVLQHLPNEDIMSLINQFHKFKYCLITNDLAKPNETECNSQIDCGGYRGLDLTKSPFSLNAVKMFTYISDGDVKEIILICKEK